MCGRYVLKSAPRAIRAQFDIEEDWGEPSRSEEWRPRFNLAPSQVAPVVRLIDGKRHVDLLRWGLIPSWAADPSISMKLINARSETAATKPAFRAAFRSHRCIVPADGFYEWQHLASGKQQAFYIHRKDGQLLAMAGLWEHWTPPGTQDSVETFTISTTEANDWMRQLHDRMPLVLEGNAVAAWLNPEAKTEDLQRLMRPLGDEQLAAYPVSKAVRNVHNDQPALVEPI